MNNLKRTFVFSFLLFIVGCSFIRRNLSDRHPGYEVNLAVKPAEKPSTIRAGFSKIPIRMHHFNGTPSKEWHCQTAAASYQQPK